MTAPAQRNPDRALAGRDDALPGLPYLLDNTRLSELLSESVHVTRVRYKPRTSLLVAFRRTRNGFFEYGWAATRAIEGTSKLLRREQGSRTRSGIRLLRPDACQPDMLLAVGGINDDWRLHRALAWLRHHGLQRLGAPQSAASLHDGGLGARTGVLRYKPERRLVLLVQDAATPLVIKAAAAPANVEQQVLFQRRLHKLGIPLLPPHGDDDCARHGISASTAWGRGDLTGHDDGNAAHQAGQALELLHSLPADTKASAWRKDLTNRLTATRSMLAALLPELEERAKKLESTLGHRLAAYEGHRRPVLIHGDFSADQVLVGGDEIRIIDFDRSVTGPAEADLGSFAAAEESGRSLSPGKHAGGPKTAQLADGYVNEGGKFSQTAVDAWAAYRLFTGSVDRFRDRSPVWAADISWHLSRAEELAA